MREIRYEKLDETLWRSELDNGLSIYVLPKKGFNKKYAFFAADYGGCDMRFRVDGKWVETPAGIAHYLEHKMFDMPYGSAMNRLTENGASPNAFTSHGITGYLFSCTDGFETNLRTLLEYVSTPYFTEESVEKERGIIGQEIRMGEDNPSRAVMTGLLRALYRTHPVREQIAGTLDSIARIDAGTLYTCHEKFYNPANMVLCCSGDVEPQTVEDIAAEMITAPRGERYVRDYGETDGLLPDRIKEIREMPVGIPLFAAGSKMEYVPGREWTRRLITAQLGCDLLMGASSPLYAEMYAAGLINGSFYSGIMDFPEGAAAVAGGMCAQPGEVMARICTAAEALEPGQNERSRFDRLKKAMMGGLLAGLDSPEELCHSHAERHFDGVLPLEQMDVVEGIGAEEAVSLVKELFAAERMAMSEIVPPGGEA
ncbi:MAG: insulinase family protein [Oscillospiraceae bacterium]|jgi:predicted Zn-dependent peptidase|nr:insulinase family protein [Oscillospiraceae bacterium]